eukprot:1844718-Alexandrium_andersonii.AAC.1
MGPPCTSFSIARNMAGALRTRECPWGIDGLSEKDAEKVRVGNECAITSVQVMQICLRRGIPFILENPLTSSFWNLPPVRAVREQPRTHFIRADQ